MDTVIYGYTSFGEVGILFINYFFLPIPQLINLLPLPLHHLDIQNCGNVELILIFPEIVPFVLPALPSASSWPSAYFF